MLVEPNLDGGAGRRPATLLLGMQERAQALGDAARSQPWERVLCHGDLIGDNLPGDRGGWLSVDVRDGPLAPTSLVRGTGDEVRRAVVPD